MSQEEEKLYHEEIEVDESNSGENLISEDKPGDLGETNTEVTDAKDTDAKVTDAADEAEEAEEAGEAGEVSVANGDHNDNNDDNDDDDDDDDFSDLSDIDENELPAAYLADKELLKLSRHKRKTDDSREDETNSDRINEDQSRAKEKKRAKNRRTDVEEEFKDSAPLIENEDELTKKRRLLEEKIGYGIEK
ncbi:hypothetical protein PACTADRAFT_120 [Pachysolen tannophilus NRRL Y-2460]|uniref:Uncharacterized protein n=1 Tax=Pachysolen tannophilus NRRL Y-2460 TaxID=669874 RepID=A0A1E4U0T7_PACTA|nr:hypothetical protein PACTADRAFT_120 [Pachysolen tannophilus NRRL Y-2460]